MIIDSKAYDKDIINQGEQFQIDRYYEPKEEIDKRRIEIVMQAADPKPDEKILDLGCGVGAFAYHSARKGAIAYGLDYSAESIKMAQQISGRYKLKHQLKYLTGLATELPFENDFFNKIIAADFIEHLTDQDKEKMLLEAGRVLKKTGKLIVFTPNDIREKIGNVYWTIRHLIFKDKIPKNELHFGLISRNKYEPMLKKHGFKYRFIYEDITRPYLAKIPGFRYILALNLLWVAEKK